MSSEEQTRSSQIKEYQLSVSCTDSSVKATLADIRAQELPGQEKEEPERKKRRPQIIFAQNNDPSHNGRWSGFKVLEETLSPEVTLMMSSTLFQTSTMLASGWRKEHSGIS